jgi:hypothetical protein
MLSDLSQSIVHDLLGLSQGTNLTARPHFFVYDAVDIFVLLALIIFAISYIETFFSPERTGKILSHKNTFIGNLNAAPLGVVNSGLTPIKMIVTGGSTCTSVGTQNPIGRAMIDQLGKGESFQDCAVSLLVEGCK